jgi:Xaa-Pro aminopeptidase
MHPRPPRHSRRKFLAATLGGSALAGCAVSPGGYEHERPARRRDGADDPRISDHVAAMDEMFADLVDESDQLEPISAEERAARRQRLGGILRALDLDALLVEPGATMEFLTGVHWGHSERMFALVVDADGGHFWIVPGFEEQKARLSIDGEGKPGGELHTWKEHEYPYGALSAALREHGLRRLAIEPQVRYGFVARLLEALPQLSVTDGGAAVFDLRARKDDHELALMRRANELTQRALIATSEQLRSGMSGWDISELIVHAQQRLGLKDVWDLSLIGPAAAYPHGTQRDLPLARGDMVLIDTGGLLHGYQSDNTRSWVFNARPTQRQQDVWQAVRDAQQLAFESIRPGRRAGEIDDIARKSLTDAGFGPGYRLFTHRLGHGIGMEVHEDPYFDSGSQVILEPGMTLSNEPGVYVYGEFGVRIEDIVVVTEDAADHFGTWQVGPQAPN